MYQNKQPAFQQLNQAVQAQLRIYSHDKLLKLPMSSQLLGMDMATLKQYIQKQLGYSSRIHAYLQPVCSFNKLSILSLNNNINSNSNSSTSNALITLKQILYNISPYILCFTYNNTQSSQQPQYNHMPVYSRPLTNSAQTVQIVVQICQNNYFVHQSYRIKKQAHLGFVIGLCTRYGWNVYVQYYNTRIKLVQFGVQAHVGSTIGRFVDHMQRVTVTADSVDTHAYRNHHYQQIGIQVQDTVKNLNDCFQNISVDFPLDTKFYFRLKIKTQKSINYYAICRKCSLISLAYMLKNILKQQCRLCYTDLQQKTEITSQFIQQNINTIVCNISKKQNLLYKLQNPIRNCQYIGYTDSTYYFIQNSHILHGIKISQTNNSAVSVLQHMLPCPPTTQLDQDLFFINHNHNNNSNNSKMLISYAITITMVQVKYYTLQTGDLLYLRVWPWNPQQYQIQFKVVDLFCVRLKSTGRKLIKRIFYIDDPQNYMDVGSCQKFYPARLCNNVISDGSSVFAITNHWMQGVQIFSLNNKHKLCEFRPNSALYPKISNIQFTEYEPESSIQYRQVIVNYSNEQILIHNIMTGQQMVKILCEKYMNQLMCIGQDIVSWQGNQVRLFKFQKNVKEKYKNNKNEIKQRKFMQWSQPIYVGQSDIIILPSGQAVCRQQGLKYQNLSSFYLYKI